jgi:hypothetical protein
MGVVDVIRRARAADPAAQVATLLRQSPARGQASLVAWARGLEERIPSPDARLAALEAMRPALLATVAVTVQGLRNRPLPLATDELTRFDRFSTATQAMRDAFKRVHADLYACDGAVDGCAFAPRALLALARALDLQARLLTVASLLRVAMERDHWDELCRLADPLWRARAFDEAFAEPPSTEEGDARATTGTARSAFALPLLLRLVEPLGLTVAELDVVHGLARKAARRAGLRLDVDGMPHVGSDGPALMLSAHHTVRIDTRAVLVTLDRCLARLDAGVRPGVVGLRTPLAPRALAATLRGLRGVWAPGYVPTPLARPPRVHARLFLGLPRPQAPAGTVDVLDTAGATLARVSSGRSGSVYVFGRDLHGFDEAAAGRVEQERVEQRDATIRAMLQAHGEPVTWRGSDPRRSVFARAAAEPRLRLGQLVAVLPGRSGEQPGRSSPARAGAAPARLLVGRVATLAHTGRPDGRQPAGHDVGVVFWPGESRPVRVRLGAADEFEEAWWFPAGVDGEPASLVLARDRFERPVFGLVRDLDSDHRVSLQALIERGADYDRVALAPVG